MQAAKSKKGIALVVAFALCLTCAVAGIYAYLTAKTDVVNNTFTVGNIALTLDEVDVDQYGVPVVDADRVTENEYKLIPGHKYTKDPTVHVAAGGEKSYIFVKVENTLKDFEAGTTIDAQMTTNGWLPLEGAAGVYCFKDAVTPNETGDAIDLPVFGSFQLKNEADFGTTAPGPITVVAGAIQADGFTNAQAAWDAAGNIFA